MNINHKYLQSTLQRLIETPSPTGDCAKGIELCRELLEELQFPNLQIEPTKKGDLIAILPGKSEDTPRALTAHIDTLGAVVSRIYANGRLQLAQIGSFFWSSIENENVTIETASGQMFRGTVLMRDASYHSHLADGEIDALTRTSATLEVRIDALTNSEEETRELGIEVGDYVHFDPRFERVDGFIKARHLDDKACIVCVLAALQVLAEAGEQPAQTTYIQIGTYEEVAHGCACIPTHITELVALDIAPTGSKMNSRENTVSVCILDKDGPYDRQFSLQLQRLAKANDIDLRADIFPRYSSDGKAFWKTGGDARVALFGPGTDATHGYERTHIDALVATTKLLVAYLRS